MIGDCHRLLVFQRGIGKLKHFRQLVGHLADPALRQAGLDAGEVDFGNDADAAGDFDRFALGTAHAAEAGGDEQVSAQVFIRCQTQLHATGIQDGVEGAMHNALRSDVHPAAGGHLAVIGYAELFGDFPVVLIVEHADHQCIGDDDPRCVRTGREQAERMSRLYHQRLVLGEDFQVLLDNPVLQPVLADAAGFAVCHQFIGIQGDFGVQVVVDHDLERLAFDTVAAILVDRLAEKRLLGHVPIGVNPAASL